MKRILFVVALVIAVFPSVVGAQIDSNNRALDIYQIKTGHRYHVETIYANDLGVISAADPTNGDPSITTERENYFEWTFDYSYETFADGWVTAAGDSDLGMALTTKVRFDSMTVSSTFGTGDTTVVTLYKTTANVTTVDGPDTLVSASAAHKVVDWTGATEASRTFSNVSTNRPAILLDEHGTMTNVAVTIHGKRILDDLVEPHGVSNQWQGVNVIPLADSDEIHFAYILPANADIRFPMYVRWILLPNNGTSAATLTTTVDKVTTTRTWEGSSTTGDGATAFDTTIPAIVAAETTSETPFASDWGKILGAADNTTYQVLFIKCVVSGTSAADRLRVVGLQIATEKFKSGGYWQ